eukprot:5902872-Amphidinium_carterae.1
MILMLGAITLRDSLQSNPPDHDAVCVVWMMSLNYMPSVVVLEGAHKQKPPSTQKLSKYNPTFPSQQEPMIAS